MEAATEAKTKAAAARAARRESKKAHMLWRARAGRDLYFSTREKKLKPRPGDVPAPKAAWSFDPPSSDP
jgi:hypothetical protein